MESKIEKQPHGPRLGMLRNGNPPCDLANLPRCNAMAKSTGQRCQQPAMKNGKCYWHGGKSPGASKGNQNAFKHGLYTRESLKQWQVIRSLIKESKNFLDEQAR